MGIAVVGIAVAVGAVEVLGTAVGVTVGLGVRVGTLVVGAVGVAVGAAVVVGDSVMVVGEVVGVPVGTVGTAVGTAVGAGVGGVVGEGVARARVLKLKPLTGVVLPHTTPSRDVHHMEYFASGTRSVTVKDTISSAALVEALTKEEPLINSIPNTCFTLGIG